MATVLQIVDSDDNTVLDLNALDSAATGFGVRSDVDLGAMILESVRLGSFGHDGAVQAATRQPEVVTTLPLEAQHTSVDNLRSLLKTLATELARGGIIKWQPHGQATALYIDFYPSDVPTYLSGGLHENLVALSSYYVLDLPVQIVRHPYLRTAVQTGTPSTLDNGVTNREIALTNNGNRNGEVKITVTPSAGSVAAVRFGVRSEGNLTEFSTLYSFAASGATMKVDTSSSAVTDSTGGNAAVTTFATQTNLLRRFRKTITPTDTTALEGTFRCYARLRATGGATNSEFRVQLRYGFTTDDIVQISNDVVEMDWRDVDTQGFIEVDLGLVTVPVDSANLVLDFFAERVSGDQSLATDQLILIPAQEQFATVSVPGFRMGSWGRERFEADELDGTGTLKRNTYRLNANGEIGRTFPTGGFTLPAGTHSLTAEVVLKEPNDPSIEIGRLEVYETTTSTIVKHVKLWNKKNHQWTRRKRALYWTVTSADVAAGKKYVFRVRFTAATADGRRIAINDMVHKFLQSVTSANAFIIDSLNRRAYVQTGTAAAFPLVLEGDWPTAPPGEQRWVFQFLDMPTDPGYEDVVDREPSGRSVLTRAASVQIDLHQRDTH